MMVESAVAVSDNARFERFGSCRRFAYTQLSVCGGLSLIAMFVLLLALGFNKEGYETVSRGRS